MLTGLLKCLKVILLMINGYIEADPRTKLIIVLCISSIAVFFQNILILAIALILSFVFSCMFGAKISNTFGRIKHLLKIVFIIAIVQSIFSNAGTVVFSVAGIKILTDIGIIKGIEFILRIMVVIISATIITTSNYREIVQGFVQMKVPYEISFMVSVAIRFLPLLTEEIKEIFTAIQLRGIELEKLPLKRKIKLYSYIFTPVIIGTIIKAQQLSIAMETKAFRAYPTRTSYMVLKLEKKDYFLIIIILLITLALVLSYYYYFKYINIIF